MSTFKVTLEQLEIVSHPNADKIELAKVGEYRSIVPKDKFKTGDVAWYIPEQALLPGSLISIIGLEGKLAGQKKNRIKPVRLRGELSQGIVISHDEVIEYLDLLGDKDKTSEFRQRTVETIQNDLLGDTDFADLLGVKKWVPEIPVHMAGQVDPAPNLIHWIEIENIKRYPEMFVPGEYVIATEKIHGTCCLATYDVDSDEFYVSSKGLGHKNLVLRESDTNVYWRMANRYNLKEACKALAKAYNEHGEPVSRVGIFGEVYGKGVQDLQYGNELDYAVFDVKMVSARDNLSWWMDQESMRTWFSGEVSVPALPCVPIIYQGPYDYEALCELAEGPETISGTKSHIREGLVVRPMPERTNEDNSRTIAKFISEAYLTRGEGTEYE